MLCLEALGGSPIALRSCRLRVPLADNGSSRKATLAKLRLLGDVTTSAPRWGMVGRRKYRLGGSLSLLVVVAIAGCGAGVSNHDYSSAIVRSIKTNGPQQIQRATNGPSRSGKAAIKAINCVQTAGTQR